MILSRIKPAINNAASSNAHSAAFNEHNVTDNLPKFQEYLQKRDYIGAMTILEFKHSITADPTNINLWMAYCAFHDGNYKKALSIYTSLYNTDPDIENVMLNIACSYFYLGMYEESKEMLNNNENQSNDLKTRLNFHLSHKLRDENALMENHEQLQDILEDQLSLAAIHYLRAHYQEAIDIYKRLLLQDRNNLALNVYVALCYYKLDYYDVSLEVLNLYLNHYSDSVIATNLKACNHFRLYKGSSAESELRTIIENGVGFGYDLVRHNLVVFREGEAAMQVLPTLVDVIPEARLNLVIYYMKNYDIQEAYNLLKDLQPAVPQEYVLKGVVNAALGQELNSSEHIKIAEECFQLVGSSASECDTIDGRQCMAAFFFLAGQFEEVLVYLSSIKSFLHSNDTFNFNYAQAKTACLQYKEAEEIFHLVQDTRIKQSQIYLTNLSRCYVMNGKPELAWELYLKMESNSDSFNLLLLIANDCYKMGHFWYAAKAFDILDRLDPNPEFWEGKRGAIAGVFQAVIASKLSIDLLSEILQLLRSSTSTQSDHIAKVIRQWVKEQRN